MGWPKGKSRPQKDKDAIAKGKLGVAASLAHRRAISEGQTKRHAARKAQKEAEGKEDDLAPA